MYIALVNTIRNLISRVHEYNKEYILFSLLHIMLEAGSLNSINDSARR